MSELRQDPITRDWVIVNPERAARPHDRGGTAPGACPFCPGNEALTPDATDMLADADGRWLVRAVPNRFPVLRGGEGGSSSGAVAQEAQPGAFWRRLPGHGYHEVIIETPDHQSQLGIMPAVQARRVLEMYIRRARALVERDGRLRQIVLFRNYGERAGTSLSHPHSQIVATPAVAPETRRRVMDEIAFYDENGCCGLCRVVERERAARERVVLESTRFVSIAPYASRNPYHLQIVPLRHSPSFLEVEAGELDDLAGHLSRVAAALRARLGDPHYNLVVSSPPLDLVHRSASHWFIEILPRLTTPAGFELGSRIVVNVQPPERAAAELRAAAAGGA
jgi:UDPglucose--hexose-1-phosphate uridylyltransferase